MDIGVLDLTLIDLDIAFMDLSLSVGNPSSSTWILWLTFVDLASGVPRHQGFEPSLNGPGCECHYWEPLNRHLGPSLGLDGLRLECRRPDLGCRGLWTNTLSYFGKLIFNFLKRISFTYFKYRFFINSFSYVNQMLKNKGYVLCEINKIYNHNHSRQRWYQINRLSCF